MKLTRKLGVAAVMAITVGTSVALISVGTAAASGGPTPACGGCGGTVTGGGGGGTGGGGGGTGGGGGGTGGGGGGGGTGGGTSVLRVIDSCGGLFDFKERVAGTLTVDVTEFSIDPSEVWSIQATQQEYNATTGGRVGDPISLTPDTMAPLAFSAADSGFTTTASIVDTPNMTHGIRYVATRISPSPMTCTGSGFWTDHNGGTVPDPLNPTGKPDTAPALTGKNVVAGGTNVVKLGFDQEMLADAQGTPATNRFLVTVGGTILPVIAVQVTDDSPANQAAVSLTLGATLPAGQTVSVQYRQSLFNTADQLQDMDNLMTSSFGVNIPVS
ncbi:MAG TPA: SwmB domain-containing protein [Pseudonocardiaceae bacterium]|nr:SwmB domain-containing protein [Pseudonocardiaceae bacterium]